MTWFDSAWLGRVGGLLFRSTLETLGMVLGSLIGGQILGLALGITLILVRPGGLKENRTLHSVLNSTVNIGRSIPFVILMVTIMPFTRLLTGTAIGPIAAVVPLTVAAIPFVARLAETAMLEVEAGVIEACLSMGATWQQIVRYVLVPESLPSLIAGAATTAVNLVGYSTMAGAIGGGGLGDLAVRYGYQRWQTDVMLAALVILVGMVQGMQFIGDRMSAKFRRR
ncbi:MAG: ABC transporter permease [Firmicutes bacterium]|jgi:D-methionine transport system permease protein|nr:ABC transporter permease [Candidatus Fermentithermobacillaceae bacterium]